MPSGYTVLRSIREEIFSRESSLVSAQEQQTNLEVRVRQCLHSLEKAYDQLTQVYVDKLDLVSVQRRIARAYGTVQALFKEKAQARERLGQELSGLIKEEQALDAKSQELHKQQRSNRQQFIELTAKLKQALKADSTFQEILESSRTKAAAAQSAESLDRSVQVEVETKSRLYEQDPAFATLSKKLEQEQTIDHLPYFERLLAQVTGFKENHQKYLLLQAMATESRQRLLAAKAAAKGMVAEARSHLLRIETEIGLASILKEKHQIELAIQSNRSDIGHIHQKQQEIQQSIVTINRGQDEHTLEATKDIKELLKSEDIQSLLAQANTVPGSPEYEIARQISQFTQEFSEAKKAATRWRDQVEQLTGEISRLKEVEREFRRNNYDNSGVQFNSNFDVNALMLGYIAGEMDRGSLWSQVEVCYIPAPEPTYTSSSSISDSFSNGGSFGGGDDSDNGSSGSFSNGGDF